MLRLRKLYTMVTGTYLLLDLITQRRYKLFYQQLKFQVNPKAMMSIYGELGLVVLVRLSLLRLRGRGFVLLSRKSNGTQRCGLRRRYPGVPLSLGLPFLVDSQLETDWSPGDFLFFQVVFYVRMLLNLTPIFSLSARLLLLLGIVSWQVFGVSSSFCRSSGGSLSSASRSACI